MSNPFVPDGATGTVDFAQPTLDNGNPAAQMVDHGDTRQHQAEIVERIPVARTAPVTGTDELSLAAKAQMAPVHVAAPEVKLPPGRFKLSYEYNGQTIMERHRTVPHALASIRRLKMLGIVPATSTDAMAA